MIAASLDDKQEKCQFEECAHSKSYSTTSETPTLVFLIQHAHCSLPSPESRTVVDIKLNTQYSRMQAKQESTLPDV